jgi:hypothetical protein
MYTALEKIERKKEKKRNTNKQRSEGRREGGRPFVTAEMQNRTSRNK